MGTNDAAYESETKSGMTPLLQRYFLYENNKKGAATVTLKIDLKDDVDAAVLKTAANTAIKRYPYYSVKMVLDDENRYLLKENGAEIAVLPVRAKARVLGSDEVNRHFVYIEYGERTVYFSWFHALCGANGMMEYAATVLYEYFRAVSGEDIDTAGIKMADSSPVPGERWLPAPGELGTDEPLYRPKHTKSLCRILPLILDTVRPVYAYEIEIPQKGLMDYAKNNDGSPAAAIAVLLAKAYGNTKKEKDGAVLCYMAHNVRGELGHVESTCDLVNSLPIYYTDEILQKPSDLIGTYTRTQITLLSQSEYAAESYRRYLCNAEQCEKLPTLKERVEYAKKHNHNVQPQLPTYIVSYVGRFPAKGLEKYIESIHTYTFGGMVAELNAVGDKIFLTYNIRRSEKRIFDSFCREMDTAGIKYTITRYGLCRIPDIEYCSAKDKKPY